MELTMPSNDENQDQEDKKNEAKASETVTLYVTADNKIYYGAGIPKYDDPTWIKETTWGSQGIRKVLREHATGEWYTSCRENRASCKGVEHEPSEES